MSEPFVIGIDSSTQSTKAIAWSAGGRALAEGRAPVPMSTPAPGRFEQDPRDWWTSLVAALAALGREADLSRAAGLAISNQRETLALLGADGQPTGPATTWLDERAVDEVAPFAAEIGPDRIRDMTGKPPDVTATVYRLAWMRRHDPDGLRAAVRLVDVQGYLATRLTGSLGTSWTSADPFGVFDIAAKRWAPEILGPLGLGPDRFAPVHAPGARLGGISPEAAGETGLPAGTPLFAAGGDGQCAGLGAGAMGPGTAFLNLGTAIITGAWSPAPRTGPHWRTMVSPTGEGYVLEAVLRAGTFLVDWFVRAFVDPDPSPATFASLEAEAAAVPVGAGGVTASPYLAGCMNPHWTGAARAAFTGMGAEHGRAHLYRAILEALTGEIARSVRAMRGEGVPIERITVMGGGANSALWRRMIADSAGAPLAVSTSLEASSLGAGITAAVGLGWHPDFAAASAAMTSAVDEEAPDPGARADWDALLARQDALNRQVCGVA